MSPNSLFSGECSVVVTVLQKTMQGSDSPKHIFSVTNVGQSATNQRQSQGVKTECARDLASRLSPNGDAAQYYRPLGL